MTDPYDDLLGRAVKDAPDGAIRIDIYKGDVLVESRNIERDLYGEVLTPEIVNADNFGGVLDPTCALLCPEMKTTQRSNL